MAEESKFVETALAAAQKVLQIKHGAMLLYEVSDDNNLRVSEAVFGSYV